MWTTEQEPYSEYIGLELDTHLSSSNCYWFICSTSSTQSTGRRQKGMHQGQIQQRPKNESNDVPFLSVNNLTSATATRAPIWLLNTSLVSKFERNQKHPKFKGKRKKNLLSLRLFKLLSWIRATDDFTGSVLAPKSYGLDQLAKRSQFCLVD